jgi:3-oxoacyl-[acyl-carrier protein] reductase
LAAMNIDLKGKTAIVTGASRGIGKVCALTLAKAGANIAAFATNEELLKTVCGEIQALGVRALPLKVNMAVTAEVEGAIEATAKELGRIDILVNNAGITRDNLLLRMKEEDWDQVLDINLKGPFSAIKAVCKHMLRAKGGRIINMTSVSGIVGNPGQANYSSAKAGLIGLTKSVAKELASRSILVNAVAPGFIETEMTGKLDEKYKTAITERIPLGRFGKAEEIANTVLFLASDLASYITGQTLVVDGGMAMAF